MYLCKPILENNTKKSNFSSSFWYNSQFFSFFLTRASGQILSHDRTSGFFVPRFLTVISPSSEQIAAEDPHVRVQQVRDQEWIVPRPFSQLHPLRSLPGCGLHHLWVHEAGPAPELAAGSHSFCSSSPARVCVVSKTAESISTFFFFFFLATS